MRCARGLMGREEVKIAIFPSSLTHLLYVQVSGPFLVPYLSENDHFRIPPNTLPFAPKALSTLPRCPRNASIDSRPHYRFNAFSTSLPKTFENDSIARCDVSETLCACHKHARRRSFRSSFFFWTRFRPSTLIRIYMRFRFQIDAFAMKTLCVLVQTEGQNTSKCMRFQTKTPRCGQGLSLLEFFI